MRRHEAHGSSPYATGSCRILLAKKTDDKTKTAELELGFPVIVTMVVSSCAFLLLPLPGLVWPQLPFRPQHKHKPMQAKAARWTIERPGWLLLHGESMRQRRGTIGWAPMDVHGCPVVGVCEMAKFRYQLRTVKTCQGAFCVLHQGEAARSMVTNSLPSYMRCTTLGEMSLRSASGGS